MLDEQLLVFEQDARAARNRRLAPCRESGFGAADGAVQIVLGVDSGTWCERSRRLPGYRHGSELPEADATHSPPMKLGSSLARRAFVFDSYSD